jgi:hypothetical protein
MIENCDGYKKLKKAIEDDTKSGRSLEERMKSLTFAVERAKHYEEKTGLNACDVLNAWESRRNYWYMNYYQNSKQPEIKGDRVRIFENAEELMAAIGKDGFRCPHCEGVSNSPYECDSGVLVELLDKRGKHACNWKVYGLFADLGKGVYVFSKHDLRGELIFMPLAWEAKPEPVLA